MVPRKKLPDGALSFTGQPIPAADRTMQNGCDESNFVFGGERHAPSRNKILDDLARLDHDNAAAGAGPIPGNHLPHIRNAAPSVGMEPAVEDGIRYLPK